MHAKYPAVKRLPGRILAQRTAYRRVLDLLEVQMSARVLSSRLIESNRRNNLEIREQGSLHVRGEVLLRQLVSRKGQVADCG